LSPEDEFALRRRMVVQALRMLATDVGSKTVWEGAP